MNNEGENLNPETKIEEFSLDNMSPDNITNVVSDTVGNASIDSAISKENNLSNVFMYGDSFATPTPAEGMPSVETPVNTFSNNEVPSIELTPNTFMYEEQPFQSVTEIQPQTTSEVTDYVQNAFTPVDSTVALEVPVEQSVQTTQGYTDLKDMPVDTTETSPKTIPSQINNYSESYQNNDNQKSNFKFMLVFAVIMLAIILVLPYIAGYK